jgi:hypothetical protein
MSEWTGSGGSMASDSVVKIEGIRRLDKKYM